MSPIFAVLFFAWIGYAAHSDWRDRRVSNTSITLGFLLGLMVLAAGQDARSFFPVADRLDCFTGLVLGLAVMLPAFIFRIAGASDVKCFAVMGLVTGFQPLLWIWVIASLLAIPHTMMCASAALRARPIADVVGAEIGNANHRGVPYVSYLAAACSAVVIFDVLVHRAGELA